MTTPAEAAVADLIAERDRVRSLRREAFAVVRAYLEQERQFTGQITALIAGELGIPKRDVVLGHHECPTSPTRQCVYNDADDSYWDDCVYCHQPSERK
ncbi:hypothetical protein [Leifsonia sp. Leaf264]|uniref:hypothetical protein n=1 Tax=Leifsonia sp. Leaf264 TaxID=1736314 RepID=UPI000701D8A9|nr:hypothetical protein [Leifsonia sp. Leaf264]KQO98155.1 hypothetical protein ASF30_08835 [Leifsonia sp. Leaf264]